VTTILLARHGQSDWNEAQRWQGSADRPLTELGKRQATELAERLRGTELDAIYASDLRRARETAEVVARTKGLDVEMTPDLREVDVGSWEGLSRAEAEERFPEAYARWLQGGEGWDDGETYEQMSERVLAAIHRIAKANAGGRVLVVAHGGSIRAVHAAALGLDVHSYRRIQRVEPNATLSAVCIEDGRLTELCATDELDEFLIRDQERRREAALRPPTPAA
jgi:broad specificity phosphatase PhoE